MSSQSTNDGSYTLTATFKPGVNLNLAQVLVQNRVSLAMPLLPEVVRQTGVTTRKRSPDILMTVSINSPDRRYDQLYLSNYALMRIRDELSRLSGISEVLVFGQRDYSMRHLARPRQAGVAQPRSLGRCQRRTRAEYARRARPDRSATGCGRAAQTNAALGPWAAHHSGRVREHRHQVYGRATECAHPRRGTCRTRRAARTSAIGSTASRPWAWRSFSCPTPTPWTRPTA